MVRVSEQGSEVVQFVVALPLLLVVLFSIVQLAGMMLATSQVSSEITRACRQLDAGGFELAADKERFIKDGIAGASTQLNLERLDVEHVQWRRGRTVQEREAWDGGRIEQQATVVTASYDVCYRLPVIANLPGFTERTLERHVECAFVDGQTIEIVR